MKIYLYVRVIDRPHHSAMDLIARDFVHCDGDNFRYGRKEMFYLTTHSTHFIYGYMASDIW